MSEAPILVLAKLDSVHVARWFAALPTSERFIFFPTSPHRAVHPLLLESIRERPDNFSLNPFGRYFGIAIWLLGRVSDNLIPALILRFATRSMLFKAIHAVELQGGGYLALRLLPLLGDPRPRLIVTNYGSDIYWFSRFPRHKRKLKRLLKLADTYCSECERDVKLARDLGFKGSVATVFPNSGPLSDKVLQSTLTPYSRRSIVMVKGYHGWAGRAINVLRGLDYLGNSLDGVGQIIVFSSNFITRLYGSLFCSRKLKSKLRFFGKGELTHSNVLELMSYAHCYIGASRTDGISTSMLEAMAMGAIPIQTSSSCAEEWFDQGDGIHLDSVSPEAIAEAVREALHLGRLDDARSRNKEVILRRLSSTLFQSTFSDFYAQRS